MTAWKALKEGNERFVAGKPEHPSQGIEHRASLAGEQRPTAVVFGCADSRVAAEIIFDQGLGDMFVVRTAGHVMDSAVLGSIEYAVTILNVPLIVVLGHDSCGAVKATLSALDDGQVPVRLRARRRRAGHSVDPAGPPRRAHPRRRIRGPPRHRDRRPADGAVVRDRRPDRRRRPGHRRRHLPPGRRKSHPSRSTSATSASNQPLANKATRRAGSNSSR